MLFIFNIKLENIYNNKKYCNYKFYLYIIKNTSILRRLPETSKFKIKLSIKLLIKLMIILIYFNNYTFYVEGHISYEYAVPLFKNNITSSFGFISCIPNFPNNFKSIFDTCLDIKNIYLDIKDKDYCISMSNLGKYIDDNGNLIP